MREYQGVITANALPSLGALLPKHMQGVLSSQPAVISITDSPPLLGIKRGRTNRAPNVGLCLGGQARRPPIPPR